MSRQDIFNAANYEQVILRLKKGEKEKLLEVAKQNNYSMNKFIYEAVQDKIKQLEGE